jgi:signal peptide peptidase SppA
MNSFALALAGETWLMEPTALSALMAHVSAIPEDVIAAAIKRRTEEGAAEAFANLQDGGRTVSVDAEDGVARIAIAGPMMKHVPSMAEALGLEATSTLEVRELVEAADADESVTEIHLMIDSPGGSVSGVSELADAVAAASKPVKAFVTGSAASAAYWVASQADSITAGKTSQVGSIGTVLVLHDTSAAAEAEGVKVHVISSHELKGIGVDGAPLTDTQRAEVQRMIDSLTAVFVDAVASGRGVDRKTAEAWATGQVWIGAEAQARGLVQGGQHHGRRQNHPRGCCPRKHASSHR